MHSKDTLKDNGQFSSVWKIYFLPSDGKGLYLFHGRCLINVALAYCFVTRYLGCPEPPT